MSWDLIWEMVKVFGIPLTMSFIAIWAFATNRIITRGQYIEIIEEKNNQINDAQVREAELWNIVKVQFKISDIVTDELVELKRPTRR